MILECFRIFKLKPAHNCPRLPAGSERSRSFDHATTLTTATAEPSTAIKYSTTEIKGKITSINISMVNTGTLGETLLGSRCDTLAQPADAAKFSPATPATTASTTLGHLRASKTAVYGES